MIIALITLLIYLLIVGIIIWLALYIISVLPLPGPFNQIARAIIVVIGCLILILLLMNFVGLDGMRPLIR